MTKLNKKAHQVVGQCRSSHNDCRIYCLPSLVPKTFVHYRVSTRIGKRTATTIRHQSYMWSIDVYNEETAVSQLRNAEKTVGPFEPPFFGVKEQKCLIGYTRANETLQSQFPRLQTFSESAESLSRNRDPNMTQNEYVYATCCRPEVADDVISNGTAKTIESYVALNFETAGLAVSGKIQFSRLRISVKNFSVS